MPRNTRYSPELRERAVRMLSDHEYSSEWAALTAVWQVRHAPETLRTWVRRAQVDEGTRPGLSSDERVRLKELEREVKDLRGQRHLEGRVGFLRDRARRSNEEVVRYIDSRKGRWGVEPICSALQFAPSTYYAAKARPRCPSVRDEGFKAEISASDQSFDVYGPNKVWNQLNREGIMWPTERSTPDA